jgi:hypothetical protein
VTNRIKSLHVYNMRLDPVETEVWISVRPDQLTSTTQVEGRLVGPRCSYSSTVEVAYPLREASREYATTGFPGLALRCIIPEPSYWDPASPFLYQVVLELRQGGQSCERRSFTYGLRRLQLGPKGLLWNSAALTIRGLECGHCSEQDALKFRQAGYNTLLSPVTPESAEIWDLADRFGFLMIGRLTVKDKSREVLLGHPSCLGWIASSEWLDHPLASIGLPFHKIEGQLLGIELRQAPTVQLAKDFEFIAAEEKALPVLRHLNRPAIILGGQPDTAEGAGSMLGWIDPSPQA